MKTKLKYLFISLDIKIGEYEFSSQMPFEISTRKNIQKFAEETAKTFYSDKPFKHSPEDKWWFFFAGEVAVRLRNVEEIKKEEYEVLSKFQYK